MLTWLAPLLVFGIVVFVHELGHFLAAKLTGVYAPIFSLGWGSRAWGVKIGETDYRISWLPIGGYVRMASREDETMSKIEGGGEAPLPSGAAGAEAMADTGHAKGLNPVPFDEHALAPFGPGAVPADRWFESKGLPARLLIMLAGVMMNFALTITVSISIFLFYGRPYLAPVLSEVLPGKPAAAAGFVAGDSIVAVGGAPVRDWPAFVEKIAAAPGTTLTVDLVRDGALQHIAVTPEPTPGTDDATGEAKTIGKIGAAPKAAMRRDPVGLGEAVREGWKGTLAMGGAVIKVLKGLVTGRVSVKQLGGPLAIAQSSVEAAKTGGLESLLVLLAFLSINIAILNLLPIPLLDGGQILINVAESVKGSAFSTRTREGFMRVGFAAVMLLFVVVMWNDISRIVQRLTG